MVDASVAQILMRGACPTVLFFHFPTERPCRTLCPREQPHPADGHISPWQWGATGLERGLQGNVEIGCCSFISLIQEITPYLELAPKEAEKIR